MNGGNDQGSEPLPELLTVPEVAQHLRVSHMTVYRLIQAGQLEAVRVGRSYRVRAHDVDNYLSRRDTRQMGRSRFTGG